MLSRNAKQLIASDLQAQVYQQPPPDEMEKMMALSQRFGVMTRVTELESMAASSKDGIPQMISIKAVDPQCYPFYGNLTVTARRTAREIAEQRFFRRGDARVA